VFFVRKQIGQKQTTVTNPKHSFVIFGAKISYEKRVRKTLMKLTSCVFQISRSERSFSFRGKIHDEEKLIVKKNWLTF